MTLRRIYLDNAATSWPKPEQVYQAVDRYQRQNGAPAGRSAYAESLEADSLVTRTRRLVSELITAQDPTSVVFTSGCTESLNIAIHGLLRPGDRVVTTVAEHNSVLRPLRALEDYGGVHVERIRCDGQGFVALDDLQRSLNSDVRLVIITHASNVTGAIQPVEQVVQMAHEAGALVLVDAAQTLGHLPMDVTREKIDLLAAPGHKGLLGPLGTGVLYIRPGLESQIASQKQGGTGTNSDQDRQPEALPMKFEAGSPNLPGIVGLAEGVQFLLDRGIDVVRRDSESLGVLLQQQLRDAPGVRLFGPIDVASRAGLASLSIQGYDPQEVAATLDAIKRIQVRSGYHCAAAMHQCLGTASGGGTVRLSWGPFNAPEDISLAAETITELARAASH